MARSTQAVVLTITSFSSALVFVAVFLVSMQLSLPPDDLAYDPTIHAAFSDPMVNRVALLVALYSGLVFAPAYYYCLRDSRWRITIPAVSATVIMAIVVLTRLNPLAGWIGSYGVLTFALNRCSRPRRKETGGKETGTQLERNGGAAS